MGTGRREWAEESKREESGREGERHAFRAFGAAIFLNVCSRTTHFSPSVKAKVPSRPYTI